jgi:DNA-binding transcriptional ArsR family regulator
MIAIGSRPKNSLTGIYAVGHIMPMQATFEALADPTRRRILDELRTAERSVGELVTALSMSQPGVSKHLRVLKDAGLVDARADAQRRVYSVRPAPLREVDEWLATYRRFWAGRLDALEHHLDQEATHGR